MPRDAAQVAQFAGRLEHLKNRGRKAPADDLAQLSMDPSSPTYKSRIPPGEPDVIEYAPTGQRSIPVAAQSGFTNQPLYAASPVDVTAKRVLVTYGRREGQFILSVVSADLSETFRRAILDGGTAQAVTTLLGALVKVVDLTGEMSHDPTGQVPRQADSSGGGGEGEVWAGYPGGAQAGAYQEAPPTRGSTRSRSRRGENSPGHVVGAAGGTSDDAYASEGETGTMTVDVDAFMRD